MADFAHMACNTKEIFQNIFIEGGQGFKTKTLGMFKWGDQRCISRFKRSFRCCIYYSTDNLNTMLHMSTKI